VRVVGINFSLDMDAELRNRPVDGEGMREVAERIFLRVDAAIGGNIDPPRADILPVMIARRHAQRLDHAGRRIGVAVDGVV
jgi:hypothetical protein